MRDARALSILVALLMAAAPIVVRASDQAPDEGLDPAPEMSLDEVLDEHFEAVGGRAAIESIDTAKISGTMTMGPGAEAPYTIYWRDPNDLRMEFTVQGQTGVQAYDGEVGWMHMPFMGAAEPQQMPEDQIDQIEQQADMIEGPLFDHQEKGHTVEYLGTEEIEGTEAHELALTLKNGDESTIYLDADHMLQIRVESTSMRGDQEVETVSTFGSYKQVGDLVLPHSISTKAKNAPAEAPSRDITIDSYEFGVDVSEVQFSMPETSGETKGEMEDETESTEDDVSTDEETVPEEPEQGN